MRTRILHTSDFHGRLTADALERLKSLRADCDLYFDCGDGLAVGNIGIPLQEDPYWRAMKELGCSASVLGNREFHISSAAMRKKLKGCSHPVVCANLEWNNRRGKPLIPARDKSEWWPSPTSPLPGGLRLQGSIAVFGLMVPMVTKRMAARHMSSFLNTDPISAARSALTGLSPKAKLVVCLSHLGLSKDRDVAAACPEIDVIFGGHSHDVLQQPEKVGDVWIVHTGSHGRFAGIFEWADGPRSWELVPLT